MVKCLGVVGHVDPTTGLRRGKALICVYCRQTHCSGWTPRPELQAAEGKEAIFNWQGLPEEWDSAVHCSILE